MSTTPTANEVLADLAASLDAFEGMSEGEPHASAAYLVLLRRIVEGATSRAVDCASGVTFGDTHTRAAVEWAAVATAVGRLSPCLACGGTRAVSEGAPPDEHRRARRDRIPCPACGGA